MAGNAAEMRNALQGLGLSEQAARAIVEAQDIDSVSELALLKDSEVKDLCDVIRKPGGTVPNPMAAQAGQPATIRDPGIKVSLRAEGNLKLACYWLRHQERTSRPIAAAGLTINNVRSMKPLIEQEDEHEEETIDEKAKTINTKDWSRTMESIVEILRGHLGTTKVPLSYVVRETLLVPAADGDPAFGKAGTKYESIQEELIARAPIRKPDDTGFVASYLVDREKVWQILVKICGNYPECWTYIKTAQRTRDGRAAYEALYDQYLGPNNLDNMADAAETKLTTLTYQRESKRWTFERYCRAHVEQHQILENLVAHGHSGIDDRSKVRHFINGIKGETFDAVKLQIDSDQALRNDFDRVKILFSDFIKRKFPDPTSGAGKQANISEINLSATDIDNNLTLDDLKDVKVDDRYYTREEYQKMTGKQKAKLYLLRKKDGRQGKKQVRFSSESKKMKKNLSKLTRTVAALNKKLDKHKAADSDTDDETNSSDEDGPSLESNRKNSALTRQKKKQKN